MASLRHVRYVLFKGHFKDQLIRTVECIPAVISFRAICLNSIRKYGSKIAYEKPDFKFVNCLSTKLQTRNASTYHTYDAAPTSENKTLTEGQANSVMKRDGDTLAYASPFNPALVEDLLKSMNGDMPVQEMPDPFEKEYRRCFLCRYKIQPDHKNVRLLSQFVSPFTGRIYGRAITGLCIPMQKRIAQLIKRARISGFMPVILKDSKYLQDPQPYDAMSKK